MDQKIIPVYDQIKEWIKHKDMSMSTVITLTTRLIKIIEETHKDESGTYKKELLIETIKYVINESNVDQDTKKLLLNYVDSTLELTIEILIKTAKGIIDIGKYRQQTGCCLIH